MFNYSLRWFSIRRRVLPKEVLDAKADYEVQSFLGEAVFGEARFW